MLTRKPSSLIQSIMGKVFFFHLAVISISLLQIWCFLLLVSFPKLYDEKLRFRFTLLFFLHDQTYYQQISKQRSCWYIALSKELGLRLRCIRSILSEQAEYRTYSMPQVMWVCFSQHHQLEPVLKQVLFVQSRAIITLADFNHLRQAYCLVKKQAATLWRQGWMLPGASSSRVISHLKL